MFCLRFNSQEIVDLASRYPAEYDQPMEREVGPHVQMRGYFMASELVKLCEWKSPRTRSRCAANAPDFVEAVTRAAFAASHERLRIESLTLLQGVAWPVASVMLHFGTRDPYPILDRRSLWSAGYEDPVRYEFLLWWSYTEFCRELADRNGVTMRVLDRALWQFSKENQR